MKRPNEFASAGYPSGDGANIWQPATMDPNAVKTDGGRAKYPGMQTTIIKVFSTICIIMGVASIGVQIAALVLYATKTKSYVYFDGDLAGAGIWAGSFCVVAGSLGIASALKRTKTLLVWAVLMSAISIFSTVTASTLSGMAASNGFSTYSCSYNVDVQMINACNAWLSLEWALMGISVVASISSIILIVFMSVPLCCSKRSKSAIATNQGILYGTAMVQQQPQTHSVAIPRAQQTMRE